MAKSVLVKICGITSAEDARSAVDAGADAVGFVFWPGSPRYVEVPAARRICADLPAAVLRVGVFVNATLVEMMWATEQVGLGRLQLHGEEPLETLAGLGSRSWKAFRVGPGFQPKDALAYEGRVAGVLLDTKDDEAPGGTGRAFDWSVAAEVRKGVSYLILAGGLTAENVGEAIRAAHPDVVDVSTSVEASPGRKDADKVRAFVEAARKAG